MYTYFSSGRDAQLEGEHYVALRETREHRWQQPSSLDRSSLELDLVVDGSIATGTWTERTSPSGYYGGASFHGTLQLLIDPTQRNMTGKWLGFDKHFAFNTGDWQLNWVEGSTSPQAQRRYHLKA